MDHGPRKYVLKLLIIERTSKLRLLSFDCHEQAVVRCGVTCGPQRNNGP